SSSRMETDAGSSVSLLLCCGRKVVMERSLLQEVDGNGALSPLARLEAEFAKDRWDARDIPGLRYASHQNNYYILFTHVPERFRPLVKNYAKFLIAADRWAGTIREATCYLGHFFSFFLQQYPKAYDLHDLGEQDVDAYRIHLKGMVSVRGKKY